MERTISEWNVLDIFESRTAERLSRKVATSRFRTEGKLVKSLMRIVIRCALLQGMSRSTECLGNEDALVLRVDV